VTKAMGGTLHFRLTLKVREEMYVGTHQEIWQLSSETGPRRRRSTKKKKTRFETRFIREKDERGPRPFRSRKRGTWHSGTFACRRKNDKEANRTPSAEIRDDLDRRSPVVAGGDASARDGAIETKHDR